MRIIVKIQFLRWNELRSSRATYACVCSVCMRACICGCTRVCVKGRKAGFRVYKSNILIKNFGQSVPLVSSLTPPSTRMLERAGYQGSARIVAEVRAFICAKTACWWLRPDTKKRLPICQCADERQSLCSSWESELLRCRAQK